MKQRRFRYSRPRRSRGLLWILFGLFGVGAIAAAAGARKRLAAPEPATDTPPVKEPPAGFGAPETVSVWVPGPAGNLYVRDGGGTSAAATPVVFLHSLAGNGGQWSLQLDHLRRHRRAVAIDLRGHGDSDPADDENYTIAGMAGDLEAVADQLGLRRFVLAGHSLGSQVALEYAARHPDRVAGLLLVDPNGDMSGIPREEKEAWLEPLRRDTMRELEVHYRQILVGADREAARWVIEDLHLTHPDAIPAALESSSEYQPLPALAKYSGPKLSIVSDINNLPYSLHRLVPDLPTHRVPGTGHWLMMDRPELFNGLVDEFLELVEKLAKGPKDIKDERT